MYIKGNMDKRQTPVPSLLKSKINFNIFQNEAEDKFKKIMEKAGGLGIKNKSIIFESSVSAMINLMFPLNKFRNWGAVNFEEFQEKNIMPIMPHMIYFINPEIKTCKMIAAHITENNRNKKILKYYIVFLPKKNIQCERIFEMEGLWSYVSIMELPINLIPIDYDLLSMEHDFTFVNSTLHKSNVPLLNVVDSLIDFQNKFGIIPLIQGIGEQSQFIVQEMLNHESNKRQFEQEIIQNQMEQVKIIMEDRNVTKTIPSQIGRMIIIDRSCDFVSPILTPNTYSGLIDELFDIKDGMTNIPESIFIEKPINDNKKTRVFIVNNDNNLYDNINSLSMVNANNYCKKYLVKYKSINDELEKLKKEIEKINDAIKLLKGELTTIDTNENLELIKGQKISIINNVLNEQTIMDEYISKKTLKIHFNIICEIVKLLNDKKYVDLVGMQQNLIIGTDNAKSEIWIMENMGKLTIIEFLKILCLYCISTGGLTSKFNSKLQSLVIEKYGSKYCFVIENLFSSGMLFTYDTKHKNSWADIKRKFDSIVVDFNETDPDDIAYIFGGYAPLSCRIIENGLTIPNRLFFKTKYSNVIYDGWLHKDINKKLCKLKDCLAFNTTQDFNEQILNNDQLLQLNSTILLFYVGGITHAEIAALRFLSKKNPTKHIIIATTNIINSKSFIEMLI